MERNKIRKILHLTVNKKYFDEIESGKKTEDYREHKQYWISRLFDENKTKDLCEVHFRNGYSKKDPFMRVEFKKIMIRHGDSNKFQSPEFIDKKKSYFVIFLGKILEVKNYEN